MQRFLDPTCEREEKGESGRVNADEVNVGSDGCIDLVLICDRIIGFFGVVSV